jgi:uncharacterized protein YgbK (DUF1537 family)
LWFYKKVFIIADDLTGTNDTVVQFCKVGYRGVVLADLGVNLSGIVGAYDVLGINTNSRALPSGEAYRRVREVIEWLTSSLISLGYSLDDVLIYKKVDSTLRGNIIDEVRAIYDVLRPEVIVFTPAYPKQGRKTIRGIHLVNGVPVDKTYFGKDLRTPVKSSYIPDYFLEFSSMYKHIYIDELRGLDRVDICGYKVISSDIEVGEDFLKLISLIEGCGWRRVLWVGSAGLAEYLTYNVVISSSYRGPILMCIGSLNDVTRKQLSRLVSVSGNILIPLNIKRLIKDFSMEYSEVLNKVLESFNFKPVSIVVTSSFYDYQVSQGEELMSELGISRDTLCELVSDLFGRLCASIVSDVGVGRFAGIFLCGGDITMSTIKYLGFKVLEVLYEVEAGLPLLKVSDSNIKLVTKAGGFGDEWTLLRVIHRLSS